MVRTKARENAFLLLFQSSFDGADISDILSANAEVGEIETDEFCEKLISGVVDNKDEIDAVMEKHLKNWKKERISKTALTVLRMAIYEMCFCDDVDDAVAISQGVELMKKYDDEKGASFVNGILGSVSRDKNE